jgi:hypothetical protein
MIRRSCPTGEDWDLFLLAERSQRDPGMIEHLRKCSYCRYLVDHRSAELEQYAGILDSRLGSRIFQLHRIPETEPILFQESLIAAQSESEVLSPKFVNLISSDQRLRLTAVFDAGTGDTWVYVVAEDPHMYQGVLVRPFGAERAFITDDRGRVNVGKLDWDSVNTATAEVQLPQAVFSLAPIADAMDRTPPTLLTNEAGDQVQVTFSQVGSSKRVEIQVLKLSSQAADAPIRVAVREGHAGELRMFPPQESHVFVDGVMKPEAIEIFLF